MQGIPITKRYRPTAFGNTTAYFYNDHIVQMYKCAAYKKKKIFIPQYNHRTTLDNFLNSPLTSDFSGPNIFYGPPALKHHKPPS